MKSIVIYFSRADENYFGGSIKYIDKGNTEVIAEMISEQTGADLFKVEPVQEYAKDYNTCISQADKHSKENARPQIKAIPTDLDKYEIIYLGYPNYWGTMPMHMFTLLEAINTTGKTIKPFCTHEGSEMGRSEKDIAELCGSNTNIEKGLSVIGSEVY